jgi:hypothetical protein
VVYLKLENKNMTNIEIHAAVMTCLEPWFLDAVNSINNQEVQPAAKYLLVDERFVNDQSRSLLENSALDGWNILTHPINDDFASHRNWMLDQLPRQGEWIFSLDADETIDKRFIKAASETIEFSDTYSQNKVDAYAVAFIHDFGGRDGGLEVDWLDPQFWLYPDWHLKLFKNTPSVMYNGLVHEILSGFSIIVPLSDPKLTIFHRKTPEMQDISNKRWRRLDLLRRQKNPNYRSDLQGDDWTNFINAHEKLI